jgi:hypothetical protein
VKPVWHIVKESAKRIGTAKLAPHDLRRTCARLCHASGGELEQIQFLLGTFRFKRRSATLGANSGFDQPSMIGLALSRILEPSALLEGLPTTRSKPVREEWQTGKSIC